MLTPRRWMRPTKALLVAAALSFALFYAFRVGGPTSILAMPFRTVTVITTVTRTVSITNILTSAPPTPPKPRLAKHTYRPDGLLEVNEQGPHPIFELMRHAEKEWDRKLKSASKTLEEAVGEYQRRYNRNPPKGFDLWWEYATEHKVQLPDEYDQIFHDLEPFWGLKPSDLLELQAELEKTSDSYTIGKTKESDIDILTYAFTQGRYKQLIAGSKKIIELLKEIQHLLPPFRMTISPHDGPNLLSDWAVKHAALEAAMVKTYIEKEALPKINPLGWISACSPSSLARRIPINLDLPPPHPSKKTFIHDHRQTMDPCVHPNHFHHHGQFLSHNSGPTPQKYMIPLFSYCSTTIHHNIRIPVPYAWVEDVPRDQDPEFDAKLDERLLWRGSNTGIFHASSTRWRNSHRDSLVRSVNDLEGTVEILMPPVKENDRVGAPRRLKKSTVNPVFFDIAFSNKPISCSEAICPLLEEIYPWKSYMSQSEAGEYRFILDVDGNGWSGRFKRLITSNALIFKSTIYPEWYSDRIQPWLHYVPVQIDLSDLYDTLIFFRGDGNGEGSHDDLAKKIAVAGRTWSQQYWRREDLNAYFFRLILEYARLMSVDRAAMTYTPNI